MLSLLLVLFACGGGDTTREGTILALTGDPVNGATVFAANCAACHGADGSGGSGPAIAGWDESGEEFLEYVLYGEDAMPAYDGVLTDQEIADVYAYVQGL